MMPSTAALLEWYSFGHLTFIFYHFTFDTLKLNFIVNHTCKHARTASLLTRCPPLALPMPFFCVYFLLRQLFRPLIIIWKGREMSVSIVLCTALRMHTKHCLLRTHARIHSLTWLAVPARPYYSHSCLLQDYSFSTLVSTTLACPVVESWVGNITLPMPHHH